MKKDQQNQSASSSEAYTLTMCTMPIQEQMLPLQIPYPKPSRYSLHSRQVQPNGFFLLILCWKKASDTDLSSNKFYVAGTLQRTIDILGLAKSPLPCSFLTKISQNGLRRKIHGFSQFQVNLPSKMTFLHPLK